MIRALLLASLGASLALGCSNSEFAGGSPGTKKPAKATEAKDGDDPDRESDTDAETDTSTDDTDQKKQDDDDTDIDDGSAEKDGELEEEEYVKSIPGTEVTKVGINFEDVPVGGDSDFNDAVMCFTGKFKVENSNVVSTAEQTVTATTFSSSGCKHNVRAEIIHKDGSKEPPLTFDSRKPEPITMTFKVGTKLEVFMKPYDGCDEGRERNMHEAQDAQVKAGVCNDK